MVSSFCDPLAPSLKEDKWAKLKIICVRNKIPKFFDKLRSRLRCPANFTRRCSHKRINNKSQIDKGKKDNVKFIIASENTAKALDAAKKPLNLISLFVHLCIITPRIFAIAFGRNDWYIAKFRCQSLCFVPLAGLVHQKVNWMVSWTELL